MVTVKMILPGRSAKKALAGICKTRTPMSTAKLPARMPTLILKRLPIRKLSKIAQNDKKMAMPTRSLSFGRAVPTNIC